MRVLSDILPVGKAAVATITGGDDARVPFGWHVDGHVVRRVARGRDLDAHSASLRKTGSIGVGFDICKGTSFGDLGDIVEG